jgi:hypothetical protein
MAPGGADAEHPYSDIMTVIIEKDASESMEWFSADVTAADKKQDFDYDAFIGVWELQHEVCMHASLTVIRNHALYIYVLLVGVYHVCGILL